MHVLEVPALPEAPLAAAALFHRDVLGQAEAALRQGDVTLLFAPADHTHHGWRLAAVQALARAHAPRRCNAVEGYPVEPALAYLAVAPGVTGQIPRMDSQGLDAVVG